jgi:hypothetical protein
MIHALLGSMLVVTYATDIKPSFLFILGDDIGWADFHYNNGTALTPRIDKWTKTDGTILMQDFHSGGTVCSPTRATVLTGRNHFRDCVNYVYGCSDMTECVPRFNFAPKRTFTIGDAARAANDDYESWFGGKVRLSKSNSLTCTLMPPPRPVALRFVLQRFRAAWWNHFKSCHA